MPFKKDTLASWILTRKWQGCLGPKKCLLSAKDIWFLDSEAKPEDTTAVQAVVNVVADEHKRLEECMESVEIRSQSET